MHGAYSLVILIFSVFCFILYPRSKRYWECDKILRGHYLIDEISRAGSGGTSRLIYRGTILESGVRKSMSKKHLNRKMPQLFRPEVRRKIIDGDTIIAIPVFYDTSRYNRIALGIPWSCTDKERVKREWRSQVIVFGITTLPIFYLLYRWRRSTIKRSLERAEKARKKAAKGTS